MDGEGAPLVHEAVGPSLRLPQAAAAIALGVIALDVVGVAPVLLGALQDEHRLSASGIGLAAMLELLSMGVVTGLCGAVLPARRMKTIAIAASVLLALINLLCLRASGGGVLLMRTAAGAPEGVLIWITVGLIARSETPERWAGVFFTGQVVAQLALAGAFWLWVLPTFGANGGFWALALTSLLGAPIALLCPSAYGALTQAAGLSGGPPPRGWAALLAAFVFVSANGAVSVYLEPLAHQAGLSAGVARLALFTSLVAQVAGGLLATFLAGKVRYMTVFAACVVSYLLVWSIYGFSAPAWLFVAASTLSGLTALLVGPFLTPMIIEADPSRRTAMQTAGAQILGGAAGPFLSAFLVTDANVRAVLIQGAVALLLGLAMMGALRVSARRQKAAA
jgi:hypothetical protein